jgi:hypothetical protein
MSGGISGEAHYMIEKAELRPGLQATIDVRLRNLRRERRLVEKAIQALSELSQTRLARARRPLRNKHLS